MNSELHSLIAFLAVLASIVVLVLAGAFLLSGGHNTEALGVGGAVTGLIGVCGTFRPRQSGIPDSADTSDKA